MKKTLALILLAFTSIYSIAQTYTPVDEGSKVKFVIKNFGINTGGTFEGLTGTIKFDPDNPANASFDVSVDAKTVDTDIEARDKDLRKNHYFDVEKYPTLSFKSTRVTKTNTKEYLYLFGNITIKGVTKEIKFPFKATPKDGGYLFEGSFDLNRRDFNVGSRSMSLSDVLTVTLSVFAKKA
jgi:polyisoprenoid-binding protein YceI